MTGKPMPENAMERMRMTPEVYQFTKDFARKPNLLEKTGNLARNIGRGAVMAIGAPMVAESLAAEADRKEMTDVTGDVQPEMEVDSTSKTKSPAVEKIEAEMKLEELKQKNKMDYLAAKNAGDAGRMAGSGVQKGDLNTDFTFVGKQEDTTADNFEQDVVPQQTTDEMGQRSATQQAELETNQTIADNTAASQDFTPKKSVEEIEAELARDMEIAGRTRIGGPSNVTEAVDKFLGQSGLDPILLAAMNARGQQEELAGTSFPIASPLSDNPQTPPGQTNSAVSQPFAENVEPITNPSPNLNPQLQSVLNTLARGRADLSQGQRMDIARKMVSPNELAGKDQATFEALTGDPSQQQLIDASQARSRVEQKTAAKQRKSGIQSRMTDKYYPSDVARTDIQVGGMVDRKTGLGKSVGMSYTPLNGDTKVGFNIMGDPTKPQEVSTFDFVASPKTMESLQSQEEGDLGSMTFGKLFNIAKKQKEGFSGMEM
jgi:hypothetical protein